MTRSIHNVQVKASSAEPVLERISVDPVLSLFAFYVAEPVRGWVTVFPQRIDKGEKTAKLLSQKLKTDAFAFRVYLGESLMYAYFYAGELRDEYASAPDAMKESQEMDDELGDVVQKWEQGELSSAEYHSAVTEYLERHEARLAAAKEEIARQIRGRPLEERVRLICELARTHLKGSGARQLAAQLSLAEVAADFPTMPEAQARAKASELVARCAARGVSSGGNVMAYRHLLEDGKLESLGRLLRAPQGTPSELLTRLAGFFGFGNTGTSFQHLEEGDQTGLESRVTKYTPEG